MALRQADREILSSWDFVRDYPTLRGDLINVAAGVYVLVSNLLNVTEPSREDCEQVLGFAIYKSSVFENRIRPKMSWVRLEWQQEMADILARYVLDHDWHNIRRQSP